VVGPFRVGFLARDVENCTLLFKCHLGGPVLHSRR
jgi:hypothetical protein